MYISLTTLKLILHYNYYYYSHIKLSQYYSTWSCCSVWRSLTFEWRLCFCDSVCMYLSSPRVDPPPPLLCVCVCVCVCARTRGCMSERRLYLQQRYWIVLTFTKFQQVINQTTNLWWCTDRKSHSRGWFEHIQPQRLSSQRSLRSSSGRSSWRCKGHGRSPERRGSEMWWFLPHQSCWPWTAGAGWPLTPGRWRKSTGSVHTQSAIHTARNRICN